MASILGFVETVCGWTFVVGFFLCMLGLPIGGYFFVRIFLKIMGLHSATPEVFRNEMKIAKIFGFVFLVTIGCGLVAIAIAVFTGQFDHLQL